MRHATPGPGLTLGTHLAGAGAFGVAFDGANAWVASQSAKTVTKLQGPLG